MGRNESFKTLARSPNEIMSPGKRQPDITCLLKQVHITTDKVFCVPPLAPKKQTLIRLSLCLSNNGAIPQISQVRFLGLSVFILQKQVRLQNKQIKMA